jgi:hypothetical protein
MPLINFFVVFSVIWIAYVCAFFTLYNDSLYGGSTFLKAIVTTYLMILNKFNSQDMVANQPVLGPILFLSYMVIVAIVMSNFMVVIIVMEYERVKADFKVKHGDDAAVLWEFVKTHVARLTESTRKQLGKYSKTKAVYLDNQMFMGDMDLFEKKTDELVAHFSMYQESHDAPVNPVDRFVSKLETYFDRKNRYQVKN